MRMHSLKGVRLKSRKRERGFLLILLLALLSIMLIYTAFTMQFLGQLNRQLRIVEQKQIQRLAADSASPATNAIPAIASGSQPARP